MGTRRMFSNRVIGSAKFLKMPLSTQALYFHLGMNADDDGVVEAYTVMRSLGAAEDDLRILVSKGFVIVLNNEDLICYLMDWSENNLIRSDRKKDSIYKDLLLQIVPEAQLIERKPAGSVKNAEMQSVETEEIAEKGEENGEMIDENRAVNQMATNCQPNDNQASTECQPYDNQMSAQVKISKEQEKSNTLLTESLTRKEAKKQDTDPIQEEDSGNINYKRVFDLYNGICKSLPRCIMFTDERKGHIKARIKEFGAGKLEEAFRKAEESDFLAGRTDNGFKANFDWIMKKANFVKILEGNYGNATQKRASPSGRAGHDGFDNKGYMEEGYREVAL